YRIIFVLGHQPNNFQKGGVRHIQQISGAIRKRHYKLQNPAKRRFANEISGTARVGQENLPG
ncbi:MAG: hypothetical protein ACETV1_05580, partial [Candidatus Bathyarchaeia archaeon]